MVVRRLALRAVHASGPAPVYQSTVGAVLKRTAGRIPDRLALTFGDRRWSYAELDRGAGRVAAALLGLVAFAKGRLAPHKVPKSVHRVDELPKHASGKVLKRELRRQLGGSESAVGRVSAADS